jgi:glycosyltransferase involved in cell wall biosynthesis
MISFIVPSYNEEKRIHLTLKQILKSIKTTQLKNCEIIVIDDFSTDKTYKILKNIKKNKKFKILKIIKNQSNLGFGGSVKIGFKKASKPYIMMLPGDNAHKSKEISKMINFLKINKIDMVSTYYLNSKDRNFFRNIFTKSYTPLLNFIFGLKLKYYNGLSIIKRDKLKKINIETDAHCWQVELWVKLKNLKCFTYEFVPTYLTETKDKTKVFNLNNSLKVINTIIKLIIYNFSLKFS